MRKRNLLSGVGIKLLDLDLTNRSKVEKLFKEHDFDIVIHLAAQAGVRISEHSNYRYVQDNLVGFQNVMQATVDSGIRSFLYASSSSVYGNSLNAPYSENEENLKPISFYGMSKLMNEMMASLSTGSTNTNKRAMRFFTVYGPWGRPDMAYLRLIHSAMSGKKFHLLGDGSAIRDFTFVDDVVLGIYKLALELHSKSEYTSDIVNIGKGNPESILEMINLVSECVGKPIELERHPHNPYDVKATHADVSKLIAITNFKPEVSLSEGIAKTVEWATTKITQDQLESWVYSVG
jgi:UDP-glucuronate 4-epimerase